MIKIYGSKICGDCIDCLKAFDKKGIGYEFIDINSDLKLFKEFLKYRDNSSVFEICKKEGYIGIPAIVSEDGSVTIDWEKYLEEYSTQEQKVEPEKSLKKPLTKKDLSEAFKELGLKENDIVMVHASLSSLGYVCGGAQAVIEAIIETVGDSGSIMMPTQSWKNLDPDVGVHWDVDRKYWQIIRDNWPAYNKKITPTNTMGAVAEMFRLWDGTIRSEHPTRSFAAWGKEAKYLVKDHELSNIFGENSPLDKLYKLDGKVLLIGVGYDKNTSMHLADAMAKYPGKHNTLEHSAVMEDGKRVWKAYETLYVDGEDFTKIGEAFEGEHSVHKTTIGDCELRLMSQRTLVDFAIGWIEKNRK